MRVLVVGSGGREHALAWKLAGDPRVERVFSAPGSAGIAATAECLSVTADDVEGLAAAAAEIGAGLTVVGPEAPLAAGIVDCFRERGLRVFGPDRDGAMLESSKSFMKDVLVAAGVPTAAYESFASAAPAKRYAESLGYPVVVKADGLAAGKGVVIAGDAGEAGEAITSMLDGGRFGAAGRKIVVEEYLEGEEASFIALADGRRIVPFAPSQDHKAVFDGDRGPNTGGMGAYSPAPVVDADLEAEIAATVLEPTLAELRNRGIDFRGVLYAGLMIRDRRVRVLEYNVRFGDPEAQPLLVRLESSLLDLLEACADGDASGMRPAWRKDAAACVVMASAGYPGGYEKGAVISGIEEAGALDGVEVFHAGTTRDREGRWVTAGGRVLGVTARGETIAAAVDRAYAGVERIHFDGAQFRRDIGRRAIERGA